MTLSKKQINKTLNYKITQTVNAGKNVMDYLIEFLCSVDKEMMA